MNQKMIGNLINYERTKKKISMQKLCDGVCSFSTLKRAESGERLPDYFILERIIERLGKSVNKLEFLQDQEAYEICYLRMVIEEYLEEEEYEEAERALIYYEEQTGLKSELHQQYSLKIQAIIASQRDENHISARELFEKALKKTVNHFSIDNLDDCIMGEEEILLMLLYLQERMEKEDVSVYHDGKKAFSYIEQYCQDEEVRVNVYSKAAWLLSSLMIRLGNREEALWYTLQGEKLLTDNGLLLHLPQFLDRILLLEEKEESYLQWKKQRDALKQLYEEYGQRWEKERILLWKVYRQQENYLLPELFSRERKLLKKSQEKLADALNIDQKTISRIESGKYKPKAGTFQKLREYLNIDRDLCTTRIVTDDFRLLEMEREIARLGHYRRDEEAKQLYEQLKKKLPLEWRENQQYIKCMDTIFKRESGEISTKIAIEEAWTAFQITRGDIDSKKIQEVILTRSEVTIINYIAICYKLIGEVDMAIDLLERVIEGFEKREKYIEAIDICNKSIDFSIHCQKGLSIGYMLSKKIYDKDEIDGDRKESRNRYLQAYYLMKLMNQAEEMLNLQNAYQKWYGETIN